MGPARTAAACLASVVVLAVAGCGDTSPQELQTTPPTPTATSEPSPTTSPTPTLPRQTATPTAPNTTMTTPPPARDPEPLPNNPEAYAKAFVAAWMSSNRPRAEELATQSAVKAVFGSRDPKGPVFKRCEGAAGSTYCTWEGTEYTLTVRVANERASNAQLQAVTEARFAH